MRLGDNRGYHGGSTALIATHKLRYGLCATAMRLARSLEGCARASIKSDTSPVTVADLAIQAIVAARLADAFPRDSLIAEEDARLLRADPDLSRQVTEVVRQVITDATIERVVAWIGDGGSGLCSRCWTLDPIDGTKGFLHGRQYVIALALIVDGSVQMSVIGCPRLSVIQADGAVTIGELGSTGRHRDSRSWPRSLVERG